MASATASLSKEVVMAEPKPEGNVNRWKRILKIALMLVLADLGITVFLGFFALPAPMLSIRAVQGVYNG
jgi:hypothetical protein